MDALISAGVAIILDNHTSDAIQCCSEYDGNGLWWSKTYIQIDWYNVVVGLTDRYKDTPMVIGHDIRNEIRANLRKFAHPSWGDYGRADWKITAYDFIEILKEITSDILYIVEGINFANDMLPIKDDPIYLTH